MKTEASKLQSGIAFARPEPSSPTFDVERTMLDVRGSSDVPFDHWLPVRGPRRHNPWRTYDKPLRLPPLATCH